MKPLLLLIGYRAFGDWIYSVPVLPYLFEKYRVHFDTCNKVWQLCHNDPRFETISIFEMEKYRPEDQYQAAAERWEMLEKELKPDKVINLWRTLETECITERYMPEFHLPVEERQKIFKDKNFYEAVFKRCGIEMPESPKLDELFYEDWEYEWGEKWRNSHETDFVIMMPIAGTGAHKVYPKMEELSLRILEAYPNAYIYLIGDPSLKVNAWKHERIYHAFEGFPIKQIFLMTKHADMVIGPETGTMVAAGMWGTPKITLCTASSVNQCCKYHKDDYSIQSSAKCSPCHRSIYGYADCENMVYAGEEDGEKLYYPECVYGFDMAEILSVVERIYNRDNVYNKRYYNRFIERAESEIGKKIYEQRWDLIGKHCSNNMSLLDFGCMAGAFQKLSPNGFKCYGYDINPYGNFTKKPKERINILTMWDVIEHLVVPDAPIKEFNPEWLFICTPNKDAVKGRFEDWIHYRPAEHLHYFNYNSLSKLLGENGYRMIEHNFTEGSIRNPKSPEDIITVVARRGVV